MPEIRRDLDFSKFEALLKERRRVMFDDIRRVLGERDDPRYADLIEQGADPDDRSVADLLVDLSLTEVNRDVEELRSIESALGRIGAGSYGICQSCGNEIPEERLEAIPETPLCIDCQARVEAEQDIRTPSL